MGKNKDIKDVLWWEVKGEQGIFKSKNPPETMESPYDKGITKMLLYGTTGSQWVNKRDCKQAKEQV